MERHARFAGVIGVLFARAGSSAQERLDRGLVALKTAEGKAYVGWRLWADDPKDVAFNVYRKAGDGQAAKSLTTEPISHCTNCVDQSPVPHAEYFIRTVRAGKEGEASPVVGVTDTSAKATCVRVKLQGGCAFQKCVLADLDGDGRLDYVIKQPDFNTDPYQHPGYWKKSEDTYKIEAYNHDGRFMCRYDMGWSIEAGVWYSPYIVYDLDGDGKAEVFTSMPGELRIHTTTIPTDTRSACLMQDRQYRLGVAAVSMGYFYWPQLSLAGAARFPEARRDQ